MDSDEEELCPLCCTELDVTDRAIQYCECGCEGRGARQTGAGRGGAAAAAAHRRRPAPACRLPASSARCLRCHRAALLQGRACGAALPNPCPLPQTRCACSATTKSWTRRPRPAWPPSAQTAGPSTTRRRLRCSTSMQSSAWRVQGLKALPAALQWYHALAATSCCCSCKLAYCAPPCCCRACLRSDVLCPPPHAVPVLPAAAAAGWRRRSASSRRRTGPPSRPAAAASTAPICTCAQGSGLWCMQLCGCAVWQHKQAGSLRVGALSCTVLLAW